MLPMRLGPGRCGALCPTLEAGFCFPSMMLADRFSGARLGQLPSALAALGAASSAWVTPRTRASPVGTAQMDVRQVLPASALDLFGAVL